MQTRSIEHSLRPGGDWRMTVREGKRTVFEFDLACTADRRPIRQARGGRTRSYREGPKPRKAAAGQKEIMPIAGKKSAKSRGPAESDVTVPRARRSRQRRRRRQGAAGARCLTGRDRTRIDSGDGREKDG